jgi:hypothetical protein
MFRPAEMSGIVQTREAARQSLRALPTLADSQRYREVQNPTEIRQLPRIHKDHAS